MKQKLKDLDTWFQNKTKELGFDFFPINWEVVPEEVMLEVMSYALPHHFRHWTAGQSYQYNKINGSMGKSKVYELILNSNPSHAFLLESNSDIANTLVIAHCYGHSSYFKNNYLFKNTDRQMVIHAAERAQRIDDYINQYGLEKVEHILDIALSMDKNIDLHRGSHRKLYGKKKKIFKEKKVDEFADLYGKINTIEEVIINENFPPHPEYDLLWFFANYADLEDWQKDIFEIVREESYYFWPQYMTKVSNEGLASFIHAELMYLLGQEELSNSEYLEFLKIHERVVQPGVDKLNINPYFLGFSIFTDIKARWDQKHQENPNELTGYQKIREVVAEEDDISFLRNYLTQDLVNQLEMFTYKTYFDRNQNKIIEFTSTDVNDVVESLIAPLFHYRSPLIYIEKAEAGAIELVHESTDIGTLDPKHVKRVLGYIQEIWGGLVNLKTIDEEGEEIHYTYDEAGCSILD